MSWSGERSEAVEEGGQIHLTIWTNTFDNLDKYSKVMEELAARKKVEEALQVHCISKAASLYSISRSCNMLHLTMFFTTHLV